MIHDIPSSLPPAHRDFLGRAIEVLGADPRIVGIAAGGSYLTNTMDEFSDLDLVIAVEPDQHGEVLAAAKTVAGTLGHLLAAFTGEHVGEPRLLICLYDAPLLHVDLKFVALTDVAVRVEDPAVLWERGRRLSTALRAGEASYPTPDAEWIEDRFWVWVHYVATKIARGEVFEAIESLSFLRVAVLGPLGLQHAGARPSGVRRIETLAPGRARELQRTLAGHDAVACAAALRAAATLYRSLRSAAGAVDSSSAAERAAMQYLALIERRLEPDTSAAERIRARAARARTEVSMIAGSCLCGGVKFEIDRAVGPFELCHCSRCRKASGSAFVAGVGVLRRDFRLLQGAELIRIYDAPIREAPPAFRACFCSTCGSPVPDVSSDSSWLEVPAGLLDDDPGLRPDKHIFVEAKSPWFAITDQLPQLDKVALRAARLSEPRP